MIASLKIGPRLGLSSGITVAFILLISVVSYLRINTISTDMSVLTNDRLPKVVVSNQLAKTGADIESAVNYAVLASFLKNDADAERHLERVGAALAEQKQDIEKRRESIKSERGKALLGQVESGAEGLAKVQRDVADLLRAHRTDEAGTQSIGKLRDANVAFGKALENLIEFQTNLAQEQGKYSAELAATTGTEIAVLAVAALLLAVLMGYLVTRSITGPTNQVVVAAKKMAVGDFDFELKSDARDEIGEVVRAVSDVQAAVRGLKLELVRLTEASRQGLLSERGKTEQFMGDYSAIVGGTNTMLDAILLPIGEGNRILAQVSAGKIDELIAQTYQGDHEKMKIAVNNVATTIQGLHREFARLTEASKQGLLSERGKPERFQGAYAEIIRGTNAMLDAILLPIGEGNRVLRLISGGDLRESVQIECHGDHQRMKDAVNGVHSWLTELIAYVTRIANGDMDATMNKASQDDQIHEWLVMMKTNINALIRDAATLSNAAIEGRLEVRADASKHQGGYREIIQGVNGMFDAVVNPLTEVMRVMAAVEQGDLTQHIDAEYRGQLKKLCDNVNNTVSRLAQTITDVNGTADSLADATAQVSSTAQSLS
jgi:methyl-accepting chemotaxis protein